MWLQHIIHRIWLFRLFQSARKIPNIHKLSYRLKLYIVTFMTCEQRTSRLLSTGKTFLFPYMPSAGVAPEDRERPSIPSGGSYMHCCGWE